MIPSDVPEPKIWVLFMVLTCVVVLSGDIVLARFMLFARVMVLHHAMVLAHSMVLAVHNKLELSDNMSQRVTSLSECSLVVFFKTGSQ